MADDAPEPSAAGRDVPADRLSHRETARALDAFLYTHGAWGAWAQMASLQSAAFTGYALWLGVSEAELDLDRPQRFLRDWCVDNDAVFVDPLSRMRSLPDEQRRRLYYTPDAHLTPAGHRVVGEVLAPAVLESLAR